SSSGGPTGGIHWHMNVANEVTYISTDEKRQNIPWVRLKDGSGNVVEYMTRDAGLTSQAIEQASKRRMDCIDCHNRPTHIYLSPNEAMDRSLSAAKIDVSLPFIKAKAVEVLNGAYETNDQALAAISTGLTDFYRSNYADIYQQRRPAIDSAIVEVQRIYQTYFFPEMKTDWRAHLNKIGHYNAQACFRCHDGQHFSSDGRTIRNDCNICHTTLDQTFGGKTTTINGPFRHPVELGDKNTWQCAACHKGDRPFRHPLDLGDISQLKCADCHTGGYDRVN